MGKEGAYFDMVISGKIRSIKGGRRGNETECRRRKAEGRPDNFHSLTDENFIISLPTLAVMCKLVKEFTQG